EQIPINQEEAGEAVLANKAQFLLQALFDTLRNAPVDEAIAVAGSLPAYGLEVFVGRRAVGGAVVGEAVVEVRREVEGAAVGDAAALVKRFRPFVEELLHLFGRLQVVLAVFSSLAV